MDVSLEDLDKLIEAKLAKQDSVPGASSENTIDEDEYVIAYLSPKADMQQVINKLNEITTSINKTLRRDRI